MHHFDYEKYIEDKLKNAAEFYNKALSELKAIEVDQSMNPDEKFDKMVAILKTLEAPKV